MRMLLVLGARPGLRPARLRRPADDGRRPARGQVGLRPAGLARRQAGRLRRRASSTARRTSRTATSGSSPLDGGEPRRLTTAAGRRQPPALEPRRQDDRVRLRPGAARRRSGSCRSTAARPAKLTKLPIDVSAPIWSPKGDKTRLHRRGLSRQDARGDRREGQGEGGRQEQGADLRPADDPPLERLGRGEAEPPVRRRRQDRRGEGPDPQAGRQHPPCPVRRLDGLRLVARRHGAGLHRPSRSKDARLVDEHGHLDGPRRGRRAEEPHGREQGGRRPAELFAGREVPRLREPGAERVRVGPVGPDAARPRRAAIGSR